MENIQVRCLFCKNTFDIKSSEIRKKDLFIDGSHAIELHFCPFCKTESYVENSQEVMVSSGNRCLAYSV